MSIWGEGIIIDTMLHREAKQAESPIKQMTQKTRTLIHNKSRKETEFWRKNSVSLNYSALSFDMNEPIYEHPSYIYKESKQWWKLAPVSAPIGWTVQMTFTFSNR